MDGEPVEPLDAVDDREPRNPVRQSAPADRSGPSGGAVPYGVAAGEPVTAPEPPSTGDPGVDEAVRLVAGAVHGSLDDQLVAYESAHRTLQDRLADVES
jgi:hypothetical protein